MDIPARAYVNPAVPAVAFVIPLPSQAVRLPHPQTQQKITLSGFKNDIDRLIRRINQIVMEPHP